MSGITLYQPNGVGLLNAAGAQHPSPVEIDVDQICQLAFTGSSTIYRWVLSKPSNSASVLSSNGSAGPSFVPDIEGGSYSISLFDSNEVEYILDIVTPTTGTGGSSGGGSSVSVAIEDYATVRASSFAGGTPPATFVVLRRETVGDGGEGTFVLLEGDSTTDDNDGTILVDSDGNRFARVFTGPVDARWFGVVAYSVRDDSYVGNGAVDSTAALQAALDAAGPLLATGGFASHEVLLPYGFVRIDGPVEIRRRVRLRGHGKLASMLMCRNLVDCLQIRGAGQASDGGNADYSELEGFGIDTFFSDGSGRGILVDAAYASISHVSIGSTGGAAIQIGDPSSGGNSHNWKINDVVMGSCGGRVPGTGDQEDDLADPTFSGNAAFWVYYGNAGVMLGGSILGGLGRGIVEDAAVGSLQLLGNKYVGVHIEAVDEETAVIGNLTCRTQFFGVYLEGPAAVVSAPAAIFGGYPSNSYDAGSGALIFQDGLTVYPFSVGLPVYSGNDACGALIGGDGAYPSAIGMVASNALTGTEDVRWFWDYTNRAWVLARHDPGVALAVVARITAYGNTYAYAQLELPRLLLGADKVRLDSGSAEPSTGLWRKGDTRWNSAVATGGVIAWTCITAGGWGDTRTNLTAYAKYALIVVSGHVYEQINEATGTSAGSSPSFTTGSGDEIVDGTCLWKERGLNPPVFDRIYAASMGAFSRVVRGQPWFSDSTEWALDEDGHATTTVDTETYAYYQLEVPNGATITVVSMTLDPAAHGALPANMPQISLRSVLYDGTVSVSGPATDASATAGDYAGYHVVELSGLSVVVNNVDNRYVVKIRSEYGANAATGMKILDVYATITPAAPDRGAA